MQIRNFLRPTVSAGRPFQGQGVSVYVGSTLPLAYRRMRTNLLTSSGIRLATVGTITTRFAFSEGTGGEELSIDLDLSDYAPGNVWTDVRHYRDDVEWDGAHPQRIVLDSSGDSDITFGGSATSLGWVARTGGVVRFQFLFTAGVSGAAPETFELIRVSGPTSPDAVSFNHRGTSVYQVDTVVLDDSDVYEFTIDAVNGDDRATLLSFANVQADASGPPAVNNLVAETI